MGTARLLETVNNRTRSVGRAVRRPYSDSEESDNDVLYAEEHDSTAQQVSLRNDWFLPADERAGDLTATESEIEVSDSESEVEYIEPDLTPLQTEMTAQQLLCPPVVAQTRPMEGCNPALPRRLRRGRDVLMEDGAVAVDTRQVSAASDTVVSRKIHRKSEYVPTVVPKLAAAPQTASEVVQPRPRDYGCTDLLPPVGECLESLGIDTSDAGESGMEVAGGSPLRRLRAFIEESDSAVGRRLHRRLAQDLAVCVVKSTDNPASGHPRSPVGHRIVSRPRRPRRLKGVASSAGGPESSGRPTAEMSSVQTPLELALPRFAMADGPRQVHPLWSVTSESPASPAQSQIEPHGDRTPAVQWTRHRFRRCTSIWTHFHHHRTRSHWM